MAYFYLISDGITYIGRLSVVLTEKTRSKIGGIKRRDRNEETYEDEGSGEQLGMGSSLGWGAAWDGEQLGMGRTHIENK